MVYSGYKGITVIEIDNTDKSTPHTCCPKISFYSINTKVQNLAEIKHDCETKNHKIITNCNDKHKGEMFNHQKIVN